MSEPIPAAVQSIIERLEAGELSMTRVKLAIHLAYCSGRYDKNEEFIAALNRLAPSSDQLAAPK